MNSVVDDSGDCSAARANEIVDSDRFIEVGDSDDILLFMQDGENRRLLADRLESRYTITSDADARILDETFDLCIVDRPCFARHADALADRKIRAEPAFLPYLLVLDETSSASTEFDVWDRIDELIVTPIDPQELEGRLEGLLKRRRLSEALADSEARFRRVFETLPDPVLIVDADDRIRRVNPALSHRTEIDRDAIIGEQLASIDALTPDTRRVLEHLVERARVASGDRDAEAASRTITSSVEDIEDPNHDRSLDADSDLVSNPGASATVSYPGEDGEMRFAEPETTVLHADTCNGDVLCLLRDVTDRITRERALKRQTQRLDDFAGMLAHEVRNPLTLAQGYLQRIEPCDEAEATAHEHIERAHDRIERMISELLAHARHSHALEDITTVDVAQIARTAWDQLAAPEATLEILDTDPVTTDPERLRMLLENLFRNAVEHAGPDVTVRVGALETESGFFVADDGPGIPPDERDSVFESGYTTTSTGTGLGLALVAQIAETHGWTTTVETSELGGARFAFAERTEDGDRSVDSNVDGSSGEGAR